MFKSVIAVLIALFMGQSAFAQGCTEMIKLQKPYKGMIMTIGDVTVENVFDGKKYSFYYFHDGKRLGTTWTVLPKDSKYQIRNGDTFAWIPTPANVTSVYPREEQERYDPTVFRGTKCEPMSIDFSGAPKNIPL